MNAACAFQPIEAVEYGDMWHKTGSLQSLLKQNHFSTGLSHALAAESNHATLHV